MRDPQQRFTIMALMVVTSMLLACAGSTSSNDMGGDTADAGDDVYNCGGPYRKAELDEAWAHFGTASGRGSDEAEAGDWSTFVENWGNLFTAGISVLPAPDGIFIHPRAAEPTKLSSSHNRPAPEAVTSARADVRPTGAPAFRAFLRHRSTLVPFLRQAGFVTLGRASACRHR